MVNTGTVNGVYLVDIDLSVSTTSLVVGRGSVLVVGGNNNMQNGILNFGPYQYVGTLEKDLGFVLFRKPDLSKVVFSNSPTPSGFSHLSSLIGTEQDGFRYFFGLYVFNSADTTVNNF